MFWQYASDTNEYLLDAINEYLYPNSHIIHGIQLTILAPEAPSSRLDFFN